MHRVELKGNKKVNLSNFISPVPNAPCGVERYQLLKTFSFWRGVPNAPCGVESPVVAFFALLFFFVPNAPCGVERSLG